MPAIARHLALTLLALTALLTSVALPRAAELVLRRGVNIEAWQTWTNRATFLSPGYDRTNYPDWQKRVDAGRLAELRAQGFDFVRLNVDPSPMFWVTPDEVTPLLDRVVAATRRLQAAGFVVIVDLHLMPDMVDRPDGLHEVLGTGGRDAVSFDRYVALVGRVAARLAPLPRDKTALELVNEPDQDWFSRVAITDRWPAQLTALHRAARKAAPELTLVLSGSRSSLIPGLLRLDPTPWAGDPDVLWTFHYYEPMAVTHAGQPWEESAARFLTHLPYPAESIDDATAEARLSAARRAIEATIADPGRRRELTAAVVKAMATYRASRAGPASIAADFAQVADWARTNRIPPSRILLGEFGVFQEGADPAARATVLRATREAAEAAGFAWAVYTIGFSGPRRSFGILDGPTSARLEPAVASALGFAPR